MNNSERFGKLRSSFALNSAQGWKKEGNKYIKKPVCLFHQGQRTRATEPLHKERDGNSKAELGGRGVSAQVYEAPGNTATVDPDFWENTKKRWPRFT